MKFRRFIRSLLQHGAMQNRAVELVENLEEIFGISLYVDEERFNRAWRQVYRAFKLWIEDVDYVRVPADAIVHVTLSRLCYELVRVNAADIDDVVELVALNQQGEAVDDADYRRFVALYVQFPNEMFALHLCADTLEHVVAMAAKGRITPSFFSSRRCDIIEAACLRIAANPLDAYAFIDVLELSAFVR